MKSQVIALLLVGSIIPLSACQNRNEAPRSPEEPTQEQPSPEEPTQEQPSPEEPTQEQQNNPGMGESNNMPETESEN